MNAKRRTALRFGIFLMCLSALPCVADEIQFQNQKGLQTGVVVREDDQSVTIRFPKKAIKSITRTQAESSTPLSDKVIWEEGGDYLILKIPRQSIQIVPEETQAGTPPVKQEPARPGVSPQRQERPQAAEQPEQIGKAEAMQGPGSQTKMILHQELLQEEMGSVEGVIMWRGKPLRNAKVKIRLESYTGSSFAALKAMFAAGKENSSQDEIVLGTQTDSQGRYVFHKAPPGYYRLYWLPDKDTGWVRRLREKPDFEITSGKLTIANVPEKKK
jgi:hypothetical protein